MLAFLGEKVSWSSNGGCISSDTVPIVIMDKFPNPHIDTYDLAYRR